MFGNLMKIPMRLKIAITLLTIVFAGLALRLTVSSPESPDDLSTSSGGENLDQVDSTQFAPGIPDEGPAVLGIMPAVDSIEDPNALSESLAGLDPLFQQKLELIASPFHGYEDRADAIRTLGDRLNKDEIEAIYGFLLSPPPQRRSERIFDRAIKNNLLNVLRNQASQPDGLSQTMMSIFYDTDQDAAVRDYAVQHLGAWHPYAGENERPGIVGVFVEGLTEDTTSIAGTALIALNELTRDDLREAGVDIDIGLVAMEIVRSANASDLSRVTAMQISSRQNATGVLDLAGEWALDPTASYPRRLAAIAALGADGSPEALSLLGRVAAMDDHYLETALTRAHQRLAAHLASE